MHVEHLVGLDGLRLWHRLLRPRRRAHEVCVVGQAALHSQVIGGSRLQPLAALHRQDDDELHPAGCAGHLDGVPVFHVLKHAQLAVTQAAAAGGTVVVARAVADEVNEPHLGAILRPRPSMQVHPFGPTRAPWRVRGGSTIRSPGPRRISPSASVKVIEPATQYRIFSYEWEWSAYTSPGPLDHE